MIRKKLARKQALIYVLILLTVFGWGLTLMLAFPAHVKPLMLFAILLPVIPTTVAMWMLSRSVPEAVLNQIHQISRQVENDLEREKISVSDDQIPREVMPFVNAINQLLRYHHDRHQQERDFAAHASHELRTPLAGILLQTEIALATSDDQQRQKALNNVIKSITRATRLVEQLLAISRLTHEKNDLAKEYMDLVQVLQKATDNQKNAAKEKSIVLAGSANSDHIYLNASEDSLYILADNLIRNAITYTPSKGRVLVRAEKNTDNSTVTVVVEDSGPGIAEHLRERVMQRFEKGNTGSKTGTGLGLSIVKRIADLHEGKVSLSDGAGGKGLRVIVTLPFQTP